MTQAQMEQRIKQWTGDKTADYGALCNDLAQLKLQKVSASTNAADSNICRNVWPRGTLPQWLGNNNLATVHCDHCEPRQVVDVRFVIREISQRHSSCFKRLFKSLKGRSSKQ